MHMRRAFFVGLAFFLIMLVIGGITAFATGLAVPF
jgi:hypothetical protein